MQDQVADVVVFVLITWNVVFGFVKHSDISGLELHAVPRSLPEIVVGNKEVAIEHFGGVLDRRSITDVHSCLEEPRSLKVVVGV